MWIRRSLLLLAAALVAVSAAPGPDARAAAKPKTFAFVHDGGDHGSANQVFVFEVRRNRQLKPVPGSPFVSANTATDCSGDCHSLAYSESRQMVFTSGNDGISAWIVAENGALTEVAGSPFGGSLVNGVAAAEAGGSTYVYGTTFGASTVRGFKVLGSGALEELASSPVGTSPTSFGIAAAKDLLFMKNGSSPHVIHTWKVQADGSLVAPNGSPFDFPSRNGNIYVSPDARCVFIPDCADLADRVYGWTASQATAALTPARDVFTLSHASNSCGGMAFGNTLGFACSNDGEIQPYSLTIVGIDCVLTRVASVHDTKLGNIIVAGLTPNERCLVVCDGFSTVATVRAAASGKLRKGQKKTIDAKDVTGMAVGLR